LVRTNGIEGKNWNFKEGSKVRITEIEPKTYMGEYGFALGIKELEIFKKMVPEGVNNAHFNYLAKNYTDVDKGVKGFDFDVYYDNTKLGEAVPMLGDINRMMEEEIVKFATGMRSMSEYDIYIKSLYNIGMNTLIDAYTTQYSELKSK